MEILGSIFIEIFNRSFEGTCVIFVVLAARLLLSKFPKKYSYFLWVLVAFRLLIPVGAFSLSSQFSIFNLPVIEKMQENIWGLENGAVLDDTLQQLGEGHGAENEPANVPGLQGNETLTIPAANGMTGESYKGNSQPAENLPAAADNTQDRKTMSPAAVKVMAVFWILGAAVFCGWSIISYGALKRRIAPAVLLRDNIYECDNISTPFVLGFVKPVIYIPFRLDAEEQKYILLHEQYHIQRKDYAVKLCAFLMTAVYWFNPFVWVSYFLMIRDMEMSCDEKVILELGMDIKENYSRSLLSFATNHRMGLAEPLAFGEGDTRKRVKNVLDIKKPKFWFAAAAVAVFFAAGVLCLTGKNGEEDELQEAVVFIPDGENIFYMEEPLSDGTFPYTPGIRLDGSGFSLGGNPLSSYYSCGTYKIEGNRLIAEPSDLEYWYEFEIVDENTLRFVEAGASEGQAVPFGYTGVDFTGKLFHSVRIYDEILKENETAVYYHILPFGLDYPVLLTATENAAMGDDSVLLGAKKCDVYYVQDGKAAMIGTLDSLEPIQYEYGKFYCVGNEGVIQYGMDGSSGKMLMTGTVLHTAESDSYVSYANMVPVEFYANPYQVPDGTEDFVRQWAESFSGRDGDALLTMSREELWEKLPFMETGAEYVSFGMSSPWPWGEEPFEIQEISGDKAVIFYYALTSDPHVWTWRETIRFGKTDGKFTVYEEELTGVNDIHTLEEMKLLYPDGKIAGTMMDYRTNGLGIYLQQNYLLGNLSYSGHSLVDPTGAAYLLLNIADDDNIMTSVYDLQNEEKAEIIFYFKEEDEAALVTMERIKDIGDDWSGIWIPVAISFKGHDGKLSRLAEQVQNEGKVEISLEDVISMAQEEALKYYDNLQLTEAHSWDNDQIPDAASGSDGKREWWYVNFANEEMNYVSILIGDGEIVAAEHFDINGNSGLINLSDIQMTAQKAVQMAEELGLRGGNPANPAEWVYGYNFKLSYGSLADSPEDVRIFLEVIGISADGNFAHFDFDAVTGELILAEEQIIDSNGETMWKIIE